MARWLSLLFYCTIVPASDLDVVGVGSGGELDGRLLLVNEAMGAVLADDQLVCASGFVAAVGNQAPIGSDRSQQVATGGSLELPLPGSDPDGDGLRLIITSIPEHGNLDGQRYSADAGFIGTERLQAVISDGHDISTPLIITLLIGQAVRRRISVTISPSQIGLIIFDQDQGPTAEPASSARFFIDPSKALWLAFLLSQNV
jgi:hypothetical protein